MSAVEYVIHSQTPELRKIDRVVDALTNGAVILYPTDTSFSLGCQLANKEAINRIRAIRGFGNDRLLTFLCNSLSNISEFASVNDNAYRTIRRLIPGPYTFILPASKMVPKYAQNPKRKTAGIRVPDSILAQLLLKKIGSPIISITAKLPGKDYIEDPYEILSAFRKLVDVAVSSDDYDFVGESTVIDMTGSQFSILREGAGYEKAIDNVDLISI